MFDHQNGVSALRSGGAGHDFDGFAGSERRARPLLAGPQQADDVQRGSGGKVGGADGKAVAGGAGKRWLIAVRADRLSQGAAEGGEERQTLRSESGRRS